MSFESRSYSSPGLQRSRSVRSDGHVFFDNTTYPIALTGNMARTSLVTLNFPLKKRTGSLPQNAFGFSETITRNRMGWIVSRVPAGQLTVTTTTTGNIGSFSPLAPSFLSMSSLMEQRVRASMMDKIRDTGFDVAVFAGEFRETAHMFKDTAHRLVTAIAAARRGDAPGVARALSISGTKDFANLWLMIMYGIRPFVSELKAAAKQIQEGAKKERYVMVAAREEWSDSKVTVTGTVNSALGRSTITWTNQVHVSGRVKYRVTDGTVATLESLGLLNPLAAAWELTRLSFVVDWMVGVGSWLGQLSATFGKHFDSGSITTFTRLSGILVYDQRHVSGSNIQTSNQFGSKETVTCNRVAIATWPITYLPALKDPVSISHIATAVSLLRQRY